MFLGHISVFLVSQQLQTQLHFLIIPKSLISKISLVVCKIYCCVWDLNMQVESCTFSCLLQEKLKVSIKRWIMPSIYALHLSAARLGLSLKRLLPWRCSYILYWIKNLYFKLLEKCIKLELVNWFYLLTVEINIWPRGKRFKFNAW